METIKTSIMLISPVFLGGALTASNPCFLAMIPLTMAFVGAYRRTSGAKKDFSFSLLSYLREGSGLLIILIGFYFIRLVN